MTGAVENIAETAKQGAIDYKDNVVEAAQKAKEVTDGLYNLTPIGRFNTGIAEKVQNEGMSAPLDKTELLNQRVERAIDNGEFAPSPEVQGAIRSYYEDHSRLADTIEAAINGDSAALGEQPESDNVVMKHLTEQVRQTGMSREDQLARLDSILSGQLYAENSMPLLTVGEDEACRIVELRNRIKEVAEQEGLHVEQRSIPTVEQQIEIFEQRKQGLWSDTRHAGQLLFHNSPAIDAIARNEGGSGPFNLSSRSSQLERTGAFSETTGSTAGQIDGSHSNLVHWSANFTPEHYKDRASAGDKHFTPGTIAVPYAEMIKQAPYARDAEYGVLAPKDQSVLGKVSYDDGIRPTGNAGGTEMPGSADNDRVFLSDNKDEEKGVNYQLDAGRGMSYDGQNQAYVLLAEGERKGIYDNHTPFGSGENYPTTVELPYLNERLDYMSGEGRDRLQQAIHNLNQQSMQKDRYRGQVVVPLRRGVVEFEHDMFNGSAHGLGRVPRCKTTQNLKVMS